MIQGRTMIAFFQYSLHGQARGDEALRHGQACHKDGNSFSHHGCGRKATVWWEDGKKERKSGGQCPLFIEGLQ